MTTLLPEKFEGEWSKEDSFGGKLNSFGGKLNQLIDYLKEREEVPTLPPVTTIEERIKLCIVSAKIGSGHHEHTERVITLEDARILITQAQDQRTAEIREVLNNLVFKMDINDYLPKVKAWQGGYDKSFDDGYAQAKKDFLTSLGNKSV